MRRTDRPLILYVCWAMLLHAVAFAALVPMVSRHTARGGPLIVFLTGNSSSPEGKSVARRTMPRPRTVTEEAVAKIEPERISPSDAAQDLREITKRSDIGEGSAGGPIAGTDVISSETGNDLPVGNSSDGEVDYAIRIKSMIEAHKWYPALARLKNIEGTPVLAFRIQRDGRPKDARIEQSSHSSILDAAAIETIERISKFPPPPAEIGDRRVWIVPIRYQMEDLPRE